MIDGVKAHDRFDHRMFYGNVWHVCEEALAGEKDWKDAALQYARNGATQYKFDTEAITHWHLVCLIQFPIYVDYWSKHPDVVKRTPLMEEQMFDVPYMLPSGRVVRLRGKFDSVDLVREGPNEGIWLQENKTKGDIDESKVQRQLSNDLQSMLYLVALKWLNEHDESGNGLSSPKDRFGASVKGVRYNVIRRPLSGGIGTIKQTGKESSDEFYERIRGYIDGTGLDGKKNPTPGPSHYFMRWETPISQEDTDRFRQRSLDPILEQLCNWYEFVSNNANPFIDLAGDHQGIHWQTPFGSGNSLLDDYGTYLDDYIATGNMTGLRIVDNLFPELV